MEKILATAICRSFGDSDDEDQAVFINELAKSLWNSCRRDKCSFESQLAYVENYLDDHGRRLVRTLADFLEK